MGSDLLFQEYPRLGLLVRPARKRDVYDMHSRLRVADRQEVEAATGRTPFDALMDGLESSKPCLAVQKAGRAEVMFGVVPFPMSGSVRVGAVWMLGTGELQAFSRTFLRESARWLEVVSADYDLLTNFIDARNDAHIRWLHWLGFSFIQRIETGGAAGIPFYQFVRLTNV